MLPDSIALRWNIGDVSLEGFEALRLSIWGAYKVFGPNAVYAVGVSSIPIATAKLRVGIVPDQVRFYDVTGDVPWSILDRLDPDSAERLAWKFAAPRMFPERHEIVFDNECILWTMPQALRGWLESSSTACLVAQDDRPRFGAFASDCGTEPIHAGLRGLPPGFDLVAALDAALASRPVVLISDLDEHGLHIAALSRNGRPRAIPLEEVSICSPFANGGANGAKGGATGGATGGLSGSKLGECGALFVDLNGCDHGPGIQDAPGPDGICEHWRSVRHEIYEKIAIQPMASATSPFGCTLARPPKRRMQRLAS